MNLRTGIVLTLGILSGCASPTPTPEPRRAITLEELAVAVHDTARSYMLSDKKGAFLVGMLDRRGKDIADRWSSGGTELLRELTISVGDSVLDGSRLDSALVYPHQAVKFFSGGITETLQTLDGFPDGGDGEALVAIVQTPQAADITFHPASGGTFAREWQPEEHRMSVRGRNGSMTMYAGAASDLSRGGLRVPNATRAALLVLYSPGGQSSGFARDVYDRIDVLRGARALRMERLLNDSYLRTSDEKLNKAISWIKLSLDALVVEARDTFAVAGVPWDGSINGRDNAQSIAGLGLATGDYGKTAGIIRSLSHWQEDSPSQSTYGRIADEVRNGVPTYRAADVGPWFFRELYEYVTYSDDTLLVKDLYPEIKRGIEGTLKYHTDTHNLLVHGDGETWMNAVSRGKALSPRGNRAAEVQLLWYFQQLIGSYVASFVGEGKTAKEWNELARKTSAEFEKAFVDTTHHLIYDHITAAGKGVSEIRPNPILCLEIIGSEFVQQTMIKELINTIVYRHGVGTLDKNDPAFRPYVAPEGGRAADEAMFNGPVWTWLTGQVVYTLTRYDRQDFGYTLTSELADRAMRRDMIGAIPAMLEVIPRPGETEVRSAGERASLTGMAEFVRSLYQDYLGIRVDAPSNLISFQPKLPRRLTDVDFTVYVGKSALQGRYQRGGETSRITVSAPDLARSMNFNFLWMMDDGDAWRGSTMLRSGARLTIVLGPDDALAYDGDKKVTLTGLRKLKKFSLEKSFTGFDFAAPPAR